MAITQKVGPHAVAYHAPAKINLALHVIGQRPDGYHLLESVVCFCEYGDKINFKPIANKSEFSLSVCGPYAGELKNNLFHDKDNIVLRAVNFVATYILEHSNVPTIGGEITLTKNLPISSGMGGGSADAAATIRAIAKFLDFELSHEFIASTVTLGADVPMCLHSAPLVARGIGEKIETLDALPSFHLLLVNPNIEVSTPDVFSKIETKNNTTLLPSPVKECDYDGWIEWLSKQRNDLEAPAIKCEPAISDVLYAIQNEGAKLSRMSGSGATCIGIFDTSQACETARLDIAKKHPDWWCVATNTASSKSTQENES